jgi:hypothetical protein
VRGLATFPPGFARFRRIKLMSRALLVRGLSALAGYLALSFFIHRGEATFTRPASTTRGFAFFFSI